MIPPQLENTIAFLVPCFLPMAPSPRRIMSRLGIIVYLLTAEFSFAFPTAIPYIMITTVALPCNVVASLSVPAERISIRNGMLVLNS